MNLYDITAVKYAALNFLKATLPYILCGLMICLNFELPTARVANTNKIQM
jgi:hypothetical protein